MAAPGKSKDGSDDQELSNALNNKLRLRQKLLKVSHRLTFLDKYIKQDVVPNGLRIQHELYYMDASVNSSTRTNIENILKRSERDVCKALIGHYKTLEEETKSDLETVEKKIKDHLDQDPSDIPVNVETFHTRLESIENTLKNSLEERRMHKLARLTPRSHTRALRAPHAHTRDLQERRHGGTKGYTPYKTWDRSRKGKGPTSTSLSPHVWKVSSTSLTPPASTRTPSNPWQHEADSSHSNELKRTLLHLVSQILTYETNVTSPGNSGEPYLCPLGSPGPICTKVDGNQCSSHYANFSKPCVSPSLCPR